MGTNLTFQYDREADILYINTCSPYPEQESEELDDEIIARFNPETDEIENLEVLFFSITDFCSFVSCENIKAANERTVGS